MTISPEALEKARAIALDVFHNAVDSDDGSECMDMPVAIDIIATALQAERDAAAPKLPDDLAELVERLRNHRQAYGIHYEPREVEVCIDAAATIQSLVARNAELEMGLEDLLSWFPDKPSEPEWRIKAGNYGADAAVSIARSLLNKDRQP